MASSDNHTFSHSESDLKHVYFFIDPVSIEETSEDSVASTANTSTRTRSRTPSSSNKDSDSASFTTTASTASRSDMNPLAKEFTPSPKKSSAPIPSTLPQQSINILHELRLTPDKGLGLFATTPIPCGTLILCEKPLLTTGSDAIHHIWGPYCRLGAAQRKLFDSLHAFHPMHLDLAQIATSCLIDYNDSSMDTDDIEELTAEQIRVMSIFSANVYAFSKGNPGAAIYETASRLNHSCVPNVHHSFNPTLKKITVFAARDIAVGEELLTTYLGGAAVYQRHTERQSSLHSGYGFACRCPACADTTSDGRRDLMAAVSWGLNAYTAGQLPSEFGEPMCHFIPKTAELALKQAEDLISLLLAEGCVTVELMKAYRQASILALQLGDFERALEYCSNEATVEKNCLGEVIDDMVKVGVASQCWKEEILKVMKANGFGGKNNTHKKVKIRKAKKAKRAEEAKARDEKMDKDGRVEDEGVASELE